MLRRSPSIKGRLLRDISQAAQGRHSATCGLSVRGLRDIPHGARTLPLFPFYYKDKAPSALRRSGLPYTLSGLGLEVEVDEGLGICAAYLDEQEDHAYEEQQLHEEAALGDPLAQRELLPAAGEVQQVAHR